MKIIECPRDAMQGLSHFVETEDKINYAQLLLALNFDTLDVGSFVSPKAIPQMRDSAELIDSLDISSTSTKLLAIIANERGAEDAVQHDKLTYLGFPFSISEEFQKRNTNKSIDQSFSQLERIQNLCLKNNKQLVVYLSMAFGNPYGEDWSPEIAAHWSERLLNELEVKTLALSDTIGVSNQESIAPLFSLLTSNFPSIEFGAHLHTAPDSWKEKVESAYDSGCRRFDAALSGFGGCPMAEDDLVGNLATENLISFLQEKKAISEMDEELLEKARRMALQIMS